MTRRERLFELFRENPEPLVFPMVVADHAAKLARRKLSKVVTSGELLAKVLLKAHQTYDSDAILVFADTTVEAEALGCEVRIPDNDNPLLVSSPGMNKLPAQPELNLKSRLPVVLDATRMIVSKVGRELPVFTSQYFADAIVAAGGIPFIGEPLASGDIISRRDFEDFALPFLQQLIVYIGDAARPIGLHICGDTSDRIVLMRDTGADILSLDNVDLAQARRKAGNDAVLMGNVPTDVILQGTQEQVRQSAEACLKDGGKRMILSSACDIPRDAPVDNVKVIVDVGREHAFPRR
jgi:uroporphyrinogen decarboxylase